MLGLALREGHRRLTADDLATSPAARGCLPPPASGDAYVRDSRRLAAEVLAPFGWSGLRLERCLDAIDHHHRLVPEWSRGVEVELLRRADLVEGTGRLVAFGFPRRRLRGLFRAGPRDGFYPMFARLGVRMLRERPSTIPAVFAP